MIRRPVAIAIVVVAILVASAYVAFQFALDNGVINHATVVAVGTCHLASTYNGTLTQSGDGNYYYVQVNYSGSWNSEIQGFKGLNADVNNLVVNECTPGSGNSTFVIQNWNPSGQSMLCVWADKFDSSNGTLTIAVRYGTTTHSSMTSAAYGSTIVCLSPGH